MDRTIFHACQLTALCLGRLLKKKKRPRHCRKSTGKSNHTIPGQRDKLSKYHPFRSVVVGSNPAVADLLQSAFEVMEAERELSEAEVTSGLRCVLRKTKHPSLRSPQ